MQVFKQYFKIVRKSVFLSLSMYAFIFILMTILFSSSGGNSPSIFETTKCNVAIFNEDDSPLAENLEKYIVSNSKVITIENTEESIRDSLFYRESELVITIPKGFGLAFTSETPIDLQTRSIPDSTSSIFVKNMINSYLTTANLYLEGSEISSMDKIDELVKKDLSIETPVNISTVTNSVEKTGASYYFNYLAYPLLCMLILGVSMVSNIFNSKDLKMRNLCSPINLSKFNLQLFLGHVILTLVIWILFIILAMIMYTGEMFTLRGWLFIANSLIFTFTALSLSFFIGNISTKTSVYAICNCVAMGSCFLGGAFVPQEMLSDFVIKFSVINPVYWYIKINDKLSTLSIFTLETLKPVFFESLILVAFTLAFISIALLTVKQKSLVNSNE